MTERSGLIGRLENIEGLDLIQIDPYVVVAPQSPRQATELFVAARAENFRVFVFGTGSSYESGFALFRENVVAISSRNLVACQRMSEFSVRVESGVPVSSLLGKRCGERRTVGGVLSTSAGSADLAIQRSIRARIQTLEFVTARGDLRCIVGPAAVLPSSHLLDLILGSSGRAGFITAIALASPVPAFELEDLPAAALDSRSGRPALIRQDVESLLDPDSLFKW